MSWAGKKKKYSRPRKAYDKIRIEEENELIKKYGLKNKREIWKADFAVARIRNIAKRMITAKKEEREKLFEKLNKMGFKISKISDILELDKEDWLKRRLQSILIEKKIAKPKQARQLITHKHVSVDGRIVNVPSYVVEKAEEDKIRVLLKTKEKAEELMEVKENG